MKIYVTVKVDFDEEGKITPLSIIWADGREFEIDRILDVRQAASQRAGGNGIRYTCMIRGKQRYLFYENPAWFVEDPKSPDPPKTFSSDYSF